MRLDLTSLALFMAVLRSGSIAGGAAAQNMALSAASRRITLLEDQYQVALLQRHARGVTPTAAGVALARHAARLLDGAGHLAAELAEFAQGLRGQVRLVVNASALVLGLGDHLQRFLAHTPEVGVDVEELSSRLCIEAVRDGMADLAISEQSFTDASVESTLYGRDRLVVAIPPRGASPLAGGDAPAALGFRDLLAMDLLALPEGSSIHHLMERAAAALGLPLRIRVRVSSFEPMARLVAAGIGVGLMPAGAAALYGRAMGVRSVTLVEPWAERLHVVAWRHDAILSAAALQLRAHLMAWGAQETLPNPPVALA